MKKNILYIAYHYPPKNTIAAFRASAQTKYLLKNGHNIYVLTTKNNFIENSDNIDIEIPKERIFYIDDKINKNYNNNLNVFYKLKNG